MQENSKKHIYSSDNKRQLQDSRIPSNISLVISILLSVVRMTDSREQRGLYIICGPWSIVMLQTNLVVSGSVVISGQCKISLIYGTIPLIKKNALSFLHLERK